MICCTKPGLQAKEDEDERKKRKNEEKFKTNKNV
jgi:hypothetical protein